MSYESTWKRRKKRRKAKDGKSGAAGNASPLFCVSEKVFYPIKVVLSKQGKSGVKREKSSGKEEKKQRRKIFQKKIKKILDRENQLVYYNHS